MKVRTEWHDGLEFEVPTWDPTPCEWNERGSWAKDPELEKDLKARILNAIPNHKALVTEALTATGDSSCRTFWGSHGCSLSAGHNGLHVCGSPDPDIGHCSAILEWGDANGCILWWSYLDREEDTFEVSPHHWTWFN